MGLNRRFARLLVKSWIATVPTIAAIVYVCFDSYRNTNDTVSDLNVSAAFSEKSLRLPELISIQ
ncbi:MAG: hypothetical protein HRU19_24400 [Pseudobacteriovorax sp.]|nr:hypothetical protein [Pseudobacteriovorax sp.]